MTILTRLSLGQALRFMCVSKYKRIKSAAYMLDMDQRELCRAWTLGNRRPMSFDRLIRLLDKLDYEVHFTIIKKGE